MKTRFLLLFVVVLFAGCSVTETPAPTDLPVLGEAPPSNPQSSTPLTVTDNNVTVPVAWDGLVQDAKVLRAAHSATRFFGYAEADPLAESCTTPGTVTMFYLDTGEVVQYTPNDGYYSLLKDSAQITCELHNRDFPEKWDFIAVNYPIPPIPTYPNDPVAEPLEILLVDPDGNIIETYNATSTDEYNYWVATALPIYIQLRNRDNDPDVHAVYGGVGK